MRGANVTIRVPVGTPLHRRIEFLRDTSGAIGIQEVIWDAVELRHAVQVLAFDGYMTFVARGDRREERVVMVVEDRRIEHLARRSL